MDTHRSKEKLESGLGRVYHPRVHSVVGQCPHHLDAVADQNAMLLAHGDLHCAVLRASRGVAAV